MLSLDGNWRAINPLDLLGALVVLHNRSTGIIISLKWIKPLHISAPLLSVLLNSYCTCVCQQFFSNPTALVEYILYLPSLFTHEANWTGASSSRTPVTERWCWGMLNEKSSIGSKLLKTVEIHELNKNPFLPLSIHFSHPSARPLLHSPEFQTRGISDLQDKGGVLK